MSATLASENESPAPLPRFAKILLATDSSDHANRAELDAIELASRWNAHITGTHVYAAKMHDIRFKQMEGGLPEQFRAEQELERQRDVHDDLITRGLSIITDSYLDQVDRSCADARVRFDRRPLEGKNSRALIGEVNSGDYDLLVMGALGLGAIENSRIGTVCRRVTRATAIDALVIKNPKERLSQGPIVVAVDGSKRAYGGLLTAFALAELWRAPIHVVAAFDPYYHYVAFNRIAGVLSDEAGKVFKFKDQEKLHEEIIDSGLAKIYQGHLDVACSVAADYGIEVHSQLLDGKPHDAIEKYVAKLRPSLLIVGKLGIHADPDLDIGGNTEHLLNNVDCAVWLSQREYAPRLDVVADVTTSWTVEAEQRMTRVPEFVRPMAKMAILRYAQQRGHTVITEKIVDKATAELMPGHAEQAMREIVDAHDAGELKSPAKSFEPMRLSAAAAALLERIPDSSVRQNLKIRAQKKARVAGCEAVEVEHVAFFMDEEPAIPAPPGPHWSAAALARLSRVPEGFMRDASRQRIESYALDNRHQDITLEVAEAGLAEARKAMQSAMQNEQPPRATPEPASRCPFASLAAPPDSAAPPTDTQPVWSDQARQLLNKVPPGFCRDMTEKAAHTIAANSGRETVDPDFVESVLRTFERGAGAVSESMPWDDSARARIAKAPETVRGMLVGEIEGWAKRRDADRVTGDAVDAVKAIWRERGVFHLDPDDPRAR